MPTPKIVRGTDFNYFKKLEVTWTAFNTVSDVTIAFPTSSVILMNEETGGTSVVEYSFNGNTVHGELDPTVPSRTMTFPNRPIHAIWFRVKSGSSGAITTRIDAWAKE